MYCKLQEMRIDNLGAWPLSASVVAVVLLNIIFLLVVNWLVLDEPNQQLTQIKTQQHKLLHQYQTLYTQVEKLKPVKAEHNLLKKQAYDSLTHLPKIGEENQNYLMEELSQLAAISGLTLKEMQPMKKTKATGLIEIPLRMKLLGSYQQLEQFLAALAIRVQLGAVEQLKLSATHAENVRVYDKPLALDITLLIFEKISQTNKQINEVKKVMVNPSDAGGQECDPFSSNHCDAKPGIKNAPLTTHPFAAYRIAGTLLSKHQQKIVVIAPDGIVHQLGVGDELGADKKTIIAISKETVILREQATQKQFTVKIGSVNTIAKL